MFFWVDFELHLIMEFDLLSLIAIPAIGGIIVTFIKLGNESLYTYLKSRINGKLEKSDIQEASYGILTEVKYPYEIPIDSFSNITITFQGTVKRGFFSCKIVDCFDKSS